MYVNVRESGILFFLFLSDVSCLLHYKLRYDISLPTTSHLACLWLVLIMLVFLIILMLVFRPMHN